MQKKNDTKCLGRKHLNKIKVAVERTVFMPESRGKGDAGERETANWVWGLQIIFQSAVNDILNSISVPRWLPQTKITL